MPLSPNEHTVLSYWEQEWFLHSNIPSKQETISATGLSPTEVTRCLSSDNFQTACRNRGIDVEPTSRLLTPEQLACAQIILDIGDTRSLGSKLKQLGISPRQYNAWLKQPAFSNYLQRRSEALFSDLMPEAHAALSRNIQNGDLGSIKLFYEVSGRHRSNQPSSIDVQVLLTKIIDILSRHLQPGQLIAVSQEIAALTPTPVGSSHPSVIGELDVS